VLIERETIEGWVTVDVLAGTPLPTQAEWERYDLLTMKSPKVASGAAAWVIQTRAPL
jgi:hypothetical protein